MQRLLHKECLYGRKNQQRNLENGQSFVEFSIILIILMLLLSGIVDLGRAIFTHFAMQDAAEEGIIYGTSFPTDCSGIRNRVVGNLTNSTLGGGMTVVIGIEDNCDLLSDPNCLMISNKKVKTCETIAFSHVYAGKSMVISVTKPFAITMPLLGAITGQIIPLSASADGVILRPQPPST